MRYAQWVAFLLLPLPALAQDAPPEIRQFDIATIEKLGHEIYLQDQAAWHGTDALLALHPPAELQQQKVRGWIVEETPDGQRVRFIRDGADGLEAAYDIDDAGRKPRVSEPRDRSLSEAEQAQFRARTAISSHIARPCSPHYNTVILPDPQGDGWLVWALASSTTPKTWFIGGNYRFTVSKDGNTILRTDALSLSCLTMSDAQAKASAPQGTKAVAQFSTQLVSPIPVETAVFVNLESGLPMFVGTPDRSIWEIVDGHVSKVDPSKLQQAPAK